MKKLCSFIPLFPLLAASLSLLIRLSVDEEALRSPFLPCPLSSLRDASGTLPLLATLPPSLPTHPSISQPCSDLMLPLIFLFSLFLFLLFSAVQSVVSSATTSATAANLLHAGCTATIPAAQSSPPLSLSMPCPLGNLHSSKAGQEHR